jgi:hypothetical protein
MKSMPITLQKHFTSQPGSWQLPSLRHGSSKFHFHFHFQIKIPISDIKDFPSSSSSCILFYFGRKKPKVYCGNLRSQFSGEEEFADLRVFF